MSFGDDPRIGRPSESTSGAGAYITLLAGIGSLPAGAVVWLNPVNAAISQVGPGYAPLAGGMAAALPYLDDFVAGHSLDSLQRLVEVIARA